MINSMKIKVLNRFPNPLTGRKAEIGMEMNVPKNQFWFKRIEQKDCEQIKLKPKAKTPPMVKADEKKNLKGSK